MKAVLVFAAVVIAASAHVCLVFPHQRGSMQGLNMPGANDCIHLDSECGKIPMETPRVTFTAGANVSVVFQKNLNHWDITTPGSLELSIGDAQEENFKSIFSVKDTNTISLTLYTPYVIIPMEEMDHAVMQLKYVTMNPKAPAVFYQCADIAITSK